MKKILFRAISLATLTLALSVVACSPKAETGDNAATEVTATTEPAMDLSKGKAIYDSKCIVCHMADGKGVAPNFPPLAGSDYLLADPIRAVAQVLNGSNEAMVVNGVTYTMPMTPQVDNYDDAVAVVNYVLNSFGNSHKAVTVDEVKHIAIKR